MENIFAKFWKINGKIWQNLGGGGNTEIVRKFCELLNIFGKNI